MSYDIQGCLVQSSSQHIDSSAETGASASLTDSYTYDARGRITGRSSQIIADNLTGNSSLSLGYDALGRLSQTVYGPSISPVATQTVSYTMQGWEEGRSIVDDSNNTVFSSVLHYDKPLSAYGYNNVVNTISWTGKVSSWEWQHGGRSLNAWALVYDNGGRLSDTRHYTSKILDNLNAESFVYDRNSNITSYTAKNGLNSSSVENYSFLGNRRGDFSYDANGNLTCMHEWMDPDSGEDSSSSLSYNLLNLPDNVTTYEDNYMDFRFLADGTKVSAIGYEDMGYKYAGPFRYLVNEGDLYLESCDAAGGRFWCIDRDTDPDNILLTTENSYFVIDHLGGIRAIIDGTGNLFEQSDYKPYGQRLRLSGVNSRNNAYLWTGKEQQTSFFGIPWFDSGARFLFTNGIFTSQDPLAEKYPGISPYAYCKGDPVNFVDPRGNIVITKDYTSRRNIINTLNSHDSKYISFDNCGIINTTLISNHASNSYTFNALKSLVQSDVEYVVCSTPFYITQEGLKAFKNGHYYEKGITLFPNGVSDPSPDDKVYIITNSFLNESEQASNFTHEAYGHALFYEKARQGEKVYPYHQYCSVIIGYVWDDEAGVPAGIIKLEDTNEALVNQISIVIKEVSNNMTNK